jgi:hypothetical protein
MVCPDFSHLSTAILTINIDQMNEDPHAKQSWVAEGNLEKMMQTFADFPLWVKNIFRYDPNPSRYRSENLAYHP